MDAEKRVFNTRVPLTGMNRKEKIFYHEITKVRNHEKGYDIFCVMIESRDDDVYHIWQPLGKQQSFLVYSKELGYKNRFVEDQL